MEHAIRQGIDRDRKTLEGLDRQLEGRGPVDADAADAEQARIRAEREPVARYVEGLLSELGEVHARQVDRSTPAAVDPLTVPDHERPTLALRTEAQRAERVHAINLAAAQQLGTGHPLVAAWVADRGPAAPTLAPAPAPAPALAREAPKLLTPLQVRFAAALDQWDAARASFVARGGRGQIDRLETLQSATDRAEEALGAATRVLEEHQDGEPSTLRRRAHQAWTDTRDELVRRVDVAERNVGEQTTRLQRAETELGRPVVQELAELRVLAYRLTAATTAARESERSLLQAGPGGLGERRVARYLGRRDELPAADQRRYDELAGRMAVEATIAFRPTDAPGPRWVPVAARPADRDVATWCQRHDLPLTPRRATLPDPGPHRGGPEHRR